MPRFVVLRHDWPRPHLDLLLEAGPVLRAWRLPADFAPGGWAAAEPNAEHRPLYLDYEGPVAGGRGTVTRWDSGSFTGGIDGPAWAVGWAGGRCRGVAEMKTADGGVWFRITSSHAPTPLLVPSPLEGEG